jgi:hypothetical protein
VAEETRRVRARRQRVLFVELLPLETRRAEIQAELRGIYEGDETDRRNPPLSARHRGGRDRADPERSARPDHRIGAGPGRSPAAQRHDVPQSTLQEFRAQLILHDQTRAVFQRSLEVAKRRGVWNCCRCSPLA